MKRSAGSYPVRWSAVYAVIILCNICSDQKVRDAAHESTATDHPHPKIGRIRFSCPDSSLVLSFDWAKQQALSYVRTNDPVGSWYEAALPGRDAFCMRDVSHQSTGAHFLGLQDHTRNMLSKFAVNISESKDWCTFWEIDRYDRPAPVDYRNDREFWYNLTANFDIVDACYRMFLWTHDSTYVNDSVFLNFYHRSLEDYVERWDLTLDGVLERERFMNRESYDPDDAYQFCRGIPSYHEGDPGRTRAGIDLLAFQAAAYRAYARILALRGNRSGFRTYDRKSAAVKKCIDSSFWNAAEQRYYDLLLTDSTYVMSGGMQVYMLYAGIASQPDRIRKTVQSIIQGPPINIEMRSHYPEVFFRYGVNRKALEILSELADPGTKRREYPEVSYAVVGALVTGLMGIAPSETRDEISTISRLPENLEWASIDNLPYQGQALAVRHDGKDRSTLTNRGVRPVTWIAGFPGSGGRLKTQGGRVRSYEGKDEAGSDFQWCRVVAAPGKRVQVERH